MADDDSVTLNCQRCDAVITFSEVSKVTEDYGREYERKFTGKRDAGVPQHMLESYVDVEQPGKGAPPPVRSGPGGLRHILELASAHGRIDHPICAKCLDNIMRDLQEKTAAVQTQAQAYQEALQSLAATERTAADGEQEDICVSEHSSFNVSEEQLLKQLEVAKLEEQVERERTHRLELELAAAQQELTEVSVQEESLKSEEDEFWRRYDALWLDLYGHLEEVDAVATRVDVAARQLDNLRQTSVLEDCFHIWFRDRFGTISGFRLGRHKEDVKWSEVNAAWGQAVLLLDMMTRMYPDFKWQQGVLKPMASHSVVSDGKEDYKLYGPVHRMWSGRFDKAMVLYLHCLDSFARFAREKDQQQQQPGGEVLSLPNPIDPEKGTVRGLSIRYGSMVGNSDNWNKVLKYMLVDLKIMLHWVTKDQGVVNAGSGDVPLQMTAAAENPAGRAQGNALANSTFVSGTPLNEWSAERGAQSMMQTGDGHGWL